MIIKRQRTSGEILNKLRVAFAMYKLYPSLGDDIFILKYKFIFVLSFHVSSSVFLGISPRNQTKN